jgi:hypothetical protein
MGSRDGSPDARRINCPVCDDVAPVLKVSAIVRGETWSGGFTGTSSHTTWGERGPETAGWSSISGASFGSSTLATLLRLPILPNPDHSDGMLGAFLVGAFGSEIIAIYLATSTGGSFLNTGVGLLLTVLAIPLLSGLGCALWWHTASSRIDEEKKQRLGSRYELARKRFDASYYCRRDDLVFVPLTGHTVEPVNFQAWLMSDESPE